MNTIPSIPLANIYDHEAIKENAFKMVENFNKERDELLESLDIVLKSNSPFFIQRVLKDDSANIKDPKNIEGRLSVAKINGEQELLQFYWNHLWSSTTDYFYPQIISNINARYFFTNYQSWGGVLFLDFTQKNVEQFLYNHVFKPFAKETAQEVLSCGLPYIKVDSDSLTIQPFTVMCSVLNRYINAVEVVIALLFLKHGDDANWLEFSRQTRFALNDPERKHDLFHLIKTKDSKFSIGAQLDSSFASLLTDRV